MYIYIYIYIYTYIYIHTYLHESVVVELAAVGVGGTGQHDAAQNTHKPTEHTQLVRTENHAHARVQDRAVHACFHDTVPPPTLGRPHASSAVRLFFF